MKPIINFDPERRTNAQAIADLASLGILRPDDRVLDMTVGPKGGFWKDLKPRFLTTNDLDTAVSAQYHEDARSMSFKDRSFDVTVFDPPYANRGTPALGDIDDRYGTSQYRTPREVERLLVDGSVEALRVADRLVLVKCQEANVASKYRPQSFMVWEAMKKRGARLVTELYVVGRREQPTGKKQLNVWASCSVLMVFERGKKVPS